MNLFTVYLEKIYQNTIKSSIVNCQENLNKKLHSTKQYIQYLNRKRVYIVELIEKLTLEIENKYIDLLDQYQISNIQRMENIENAELNALMKELNDAETDCARIEADLTYQNKIRITLERECDMIAQMSLVA
ncbi:hypothetical protein CD149_06725 [Staphylococcus condimenti]|uniref:Uncharacterized protein n=2 Tax=Staphylococcus condimenti TaxID=70255 RepID=A0A143PDU2_9STAP|nr:MULTISPECIES: hypothetical protein [Staphylococcus]AMY04420.1 hypothetical protein A4G25_00040 [Staphylococcus condimenti]AMY06752.1 hypothetical protein A4G25_12750 [Staphylococcus condimenti]APR60656.1 hypothetical protein BTZ13_05280 [Staphylococcus condimenti]MDK8645576.1 hypothetical protein [Staphylococcus condimenti]OFP00405.1 hypothetical protein HMPREF3007_05180 [Staphylococcus sp. HMSC065E08]